MKTNSIEHQITELLREGHSEQQVALLTNLPVGRIEGINKGYIEQRKRRELKASKLHNQAIYAMNLQA